jgi:rhamnogalacturonyl hydrolase YesR
MGLYGVETDSTKKQAYYDYAVAWGKTDTWVGGPWSLTYIAADVVTTIADNQACGQTYIDLYAIEPEAERIAIIKASIDDMVNNFTPGVWWWIDALQMAMPVFAKLGVVLNDTSYFDAMWLYYSDTRDSVGGGLFNQQEGLWWRDLHFSPGQTEEVMTQDIHTNFSTLYPRTTDAYIKAPNGENLYWSRGNAWVMAALARVLDILPETDAHRSTYLSDFQAMAVAVVPLQQEDGFWTESLMDPTHCASIGLAGYDGPETSGTALFAYGLAWGIRQGILDAGTYGPVLEKAWKGLTTMALQSDGLVGYVQSTGDRPCTGTEPLGATTLANFDDYGVGCFLLAATEVYKLST